MKKNDPSEFVQDKNTHQPTATRGWLPGFLLGCLIFTLLAAVIAGCAAFIPLPTTSPQPSIPAKTLPPPATVTMTAVFTRIAPTPMPTNTNAAPRADVIGFYVNWDEKSLASLKKNFRSLDKLMPEWLQLADASGALKPENPVVQKQTQDFIKSARPDLPIMALVNNYNNDIQDWDAKMLAAMLASPAARARNIQALQDFVQSNHLQGVNIDYESLGASSSQAMTLYMSELYARFHPLGLEVSQSVPADDPGFDYVRLAKYSDYLILMVYDEHWSTSEDGPVASQNMFTDALKLRLASLDPARVVIGIGNYGYDWVDGSNQGVDVTVEQAIRTAKDHQVSPGMDPLSLNPTFDYKDANGKLHHVWFLDAATASNQVSAALQYRVRGFALWRMGAEDPATWQVFDQQVIPQP